MTRGLTLLATLAAVCAALGCHARATQETLLIAGASSMKLYLDPVVHGFSTKEPAASIVCEEGGSAASLIALKRGAIDVAMVGREVTGDENDDQLRDYLVARDGVAIIVPLSSPIKALTAKQLADVASGAVTSWKEVGGPATPIEFVDRPRGSHARKSFMDLVLGGEEPTPSATIADGHADVVSAVAKNANAIGYLTYHGLDGAPVRALPINGVEMTRATMLSGRYPLTRSFYLAIYKHPSKLAEGFVSFAVSKEGQALLVDRGLLGVY